MRVLPLVLLLAGGMLSGGENARRVSPAPTGELVDGDGKPVFLISTTLTYDSVDSFHKYRKEFEGTYPKEYDWLYGRQTSVEMLKRCGFNSLNFLGSNIAFRALSPDYAGFDKRDPWDEYVAMLEKYGWQKLRRPAERRSYEEYQQLTASAKELPVYVDFHTGIFFSQLSRNPQITGNLLDPARYFSSPADQHPAFAIRFRLGNPEGRGALVKLYRHETENILARGIHPFAYKLFNEPDYKDYSRENFRNFRDEMKSRYRDIAALNRSWKTAYRSFDGLLTGSGAAREIEYRKFLERQVVRLGADLRAAIRELDPGAPTLAQVHSYAYRQNWNNFNLYLLDREMDFISTGTGNYTFSQPERSDDEKPFREADNVSMELGEYLARAAFYRALADGKPLVTTEAYFAGIGERYREFKKVFWHEMIHGSNLVNMWSWIGYWAPRQKHNRIGYGLHSQHVVSPDSWRALDDAKREIATVGDFFQYRKNFPEAEVACLFSYPTLRADQPLTEGYLRAIAAMVFRHIPADAILEEQLAENRQQRYKVILMRDVKNVYTETNAFLKRFVEAGGLLIAGGHPADHDEYGNPLPSPFLPLKLVPGENKLRRTEKGDIGWIDSTRFASIPAGWSVHLSADGIPVVLTRNQGRGKIVVLAGSCRDNSFSEILLPFLREAGVSPTAEVCKADSDDPVANLNVRKARHDGMTAWYLVNYNDTPKLVRVSAPEFRNAVAVSPLDRESYPVGGDTVTLLLEPGYHKVVVSGPREKVEARFGRFASADAAALKARHDAQIAELEKQRVHVRPSRPVDITRFANSGFDNQQGWPTGSAWFDGTRKDLPRVPFHGNVFGNLQFDIIRFDYNDNKTCIALKSSNLPDAPERVEGIPLNGQFRGVAFLHAVTHGRRGEPAMTYRFTFEDDSTVDAPVATGGEIGDWIIADNAPELRKACAWKTPDGRGFFLFEWNNPFPSKMVKSLSILSGNGQSVPIVVAVSTLPTTFRKAYGNRLDLRGLMECRMKKEGNGFRQDGTLHQDHEALELTVRGGGSLPIPPEKLAGAVLRGQVKHGCDQWGKQLSSNGYLWPSVVGVRKGKPARTGARQSSAASDRLVSQFRGFRPEEWSELEIPLAPLLTVPDSATGTAALDNITRIAFQFDRTYLIFRDLRIEF